MATFRNNFRTGYAVQIEYLVNSQNVSNNTSNVTVKAQLISTGSSYYINSSATKNGSLSINGTTYNFTFSASLSGNQTKTVYTKTLDIPHNSDGTKSCSMSLSLGIAVTLSGTYWGTVSTSGTATFATIPRGSTFTLTSNTLTLGGSIGVNITRHSGSFTHKVYGKFGSMEYHCFSSSAGTSATWGVGVDGAKYLPNSTSGTGYIYIETYNGSTKIATSDVKTFTVKVPDSVVPTISSLSVTENGGSGISGIYVKGKSKANIKVTASGSHGSTISSYNTTVTDLSSSTSSSFTTALFTSHGTKTITTTVKDSRGRTASKSVTINVIDYWIPVFSVKAQRCLQDGTIDETNGTYYNVTYALTSYADLDSKNTVSWKIFTRCYGATGWYQQASGTGLKSSTTSVFGNGEVDPNYSHEVKMEVTDKYGTYISIFNVPTAYVTMDFLQGGKGIAFGKVASLNDTFECNMFGQFNRALKATRGVYCHQAGGTGGQSGYIKFCTLTVTGTYRDSPMTIMVARRRDQLPKELIISFNNSDTKDPTLKAFYVRGTVGNFFIHKSATSTWDLYALKNETYDNVGITDIKMSKYQMDGISVTWHDGVQVASLPSGYVTAKEYNSFSIPGSGDWFNGGTPVVGTNGVMDIGKFLDFHFTNGSTTDYDSRIRIGDTGNVHFTGGVYPHETNKVRLGSSSYRWDELYLRLAPNVSSDRNMKENIEYIKSEKVKSKSVDEVITYEDMYNFVKDDLELATYNFINSEEQKMNFIAQDLLYNIDGTDNKVGQMIINPIAPPTEEEIAEAKANLEEDEVYTYPTLSYDMGMYISVLAGALKTALNKIDVLENRVKEL